ncbi:hypothetical protein QBC40DRAFT_283226 [Triangularia verruculosa]|uniref:DUF7708 domain-containing protein n=1 Tax=Triangularia verruculosa TaxID=2587418 RepID=A0AAN6XFS7_9PEZI|nr:hypothetical protein QBC40DRAFT_283226 [Triangularia verruculosa]
MDFTKSHRQDRDTVLRWFGVSEATSTAYTIANQAFNAARAEIADELTGAEREEFFQDGFISMQRFISTLNSVRCKYESRKSGKAYIWLEKLSNRVVYYGTVLDVLVQHNPEYVSLVWGAFKFLFVSVLNHEEMVKNLAKSCTRIAETLPRVDLSLILYPTAAMRDAVARLYAVILRFVVHSVRWYRQSRIKHFLTSITNPWNLDYEPELREVEQHARNIDELAQSASHAELREAHFQIHLLGSKLDATRHDIRTLTAFVENGFQKMVDSASSNQLLQLRISQDVTCSMAMISQVQLGQILSLSFMECLPTSGQCLAYCRSFWLRRQGSHPQGRGDMIVQNIKSKRDSTFMVIQKSTRAEAKDILFESVEALRRCGLPVLWVLRSPGLQDSTITSVDVIRMLLYQALEINSAAMNTSYPITIAQLKEASTHEEWLLLLKRALRGLPTVYIVVDSDVVEHVTSGDKTAATRFLVEFVKTLGPEKVRFVVPSHVFETQSAAQDLGEQAVAALKTESPAKRSNVVVQRRRRMAKKQRGI